MKKTLTLAVLFCAATLLGQGTYWRADLPSYPPWPFNPDTNASLLQIDANEFIVGDFESVLSGRATTMNSRVANPPPPDGTNIVAGSPAPWHYWADWSEYPTEPLPGWSAIVFIGRPVTWIHTFPPCNPTNGPPGINWRTNVFEQAEMVPVSWYMETAAGYEHQSPEPFDGVYGMTCSYDHGYGFRVSANYPFPLYSPLNCSPMLIMGIYFGWDYQTNYFSSQCIAGMPTPGYRSCVFDFQADPNTKELNIVLEDPWGQIENAYWQPAFPPIIIPPIWEPINTNAWFPPDLPPDMHRPKADPHDLKPSAGFFGVANAKVGDTYTIQCSTNGTTWTTLTNVTLTSSMMGTNAHDANVGYVNLKYSITNTSIPIKLYRSSGTNYTWHR